MFSPRRGFTLIELLVSIAIFSLVLSLLIVGYSNFRRNRQLDLAAKEIQTQLRLVRTKAVAAEKPDSGCGQLEGYKVKYSSGNISYVAVCDGGAETGDEQQITLKTEVTIDSFDSFTFETLSGKASAVRTIVIHYDTLQKTLTISQSGEVTFN
jgi:prepilin-type N-terminal cleavage/methylation domain-containing protein